MRKGKLMGKIFGIALALVMIGVMLPLGAFGGRSQAEASPTIYVPKDNYPLMEPFENRASADPGLGEWSKVSTPSEEDWVLAPDSTIIDYAVADDGEVAYAIVYSYDTGEFHLLKSTDGAATWEDLNDALEDALDDDGYTLSELLQVACDAEDPDFVAVALVADSAVHVYISDDGGDAFKDTGEVNIPSNKIFEFEVSPEVAGERDIAIGGSDGSKGLIFRCTALGDVATSWWDTTKYGDDWESCLAMVDIKFAPSWATDKTILVATATGSTVLLQFGTWGTVKGWNEDSSLAIAPVTIVTGKSIPWSSLKGATAGIAMPLDYSGRNSDKRYVWVNVNYLEGSTAIGKIFRVKNKSVNQVAQQIELTPWLTNVSYLGYISEGKAIAGVLGDGLGGLTECCEGVQVYRNDNIYNMDICCLKWQEACKPPTGTLGMAAFYVSADKAYAVALGGSSYDEGAWSVSFDDGDTWNQLSLIDTEGKPDLAVDIISTGSLVIGGPASVTIKIENKGNASIPAKRHTVKVCLIDYEFKQPSSWRWGDSYQAIKWGQTSWCDSSTIDLPELRPGDSQIEEIEFLIPEPVFEGSNAGIWADTLSVYVSQSTPELYDDANKSNNGDEQDITVSPSADMGISCAITIALPFMVEYFGVAEGITLNGDIRTASNVFSFVKNVRQKDWDAAANNLVSIVLKVAYMVFKDPISFATSLAKGLWEGATNCAALYIIFVQYFYGCIQAGIDMFAAWVSCPADILIVDEQGNRAGYLDGTIYEEIEGSEVVVVDDQKLILIPWKSSYTVVLRGTDLGTMDFQMILPGGENIARIVEYQDVSISQATEATVDVSPENSEYLMMIDNNGDGQVDEERHPDVVNSSPNTPSSPSPANHASGVSTNTDLSWSGGDLDAGDSVTYDVYFGTSATPPQVSDDQVATSYDPGMLVDGAKYYWQIVATDNHGASTTGPVWDFTTGGVCQDEPSPEVGFASLTAEGKLVIAYNFDPFTTVPTAVNGWTWYDPTLPPAQNNLAKLHKNTAYWVKVTEECWLTYGTKTYHLAAGWNNPVWLGW